MTLISSNINLGDFFRALESELYVVLKKSEVFPKYYAGSDLDILCYDITSVANAVLSIGNQYASGEFTISVSTYPERGKVHIDFMTLEGTIHFRFDIFSSLGGFKKVTIKPSLALSILENRQKILITDEDAFEISVPSEVDEAIIRYLEYLEYYELRPDKIKHYDYILNNLQSESDVIRFIDKLHLYTAFVGLEVPQDTHFSETTNQLLHQAAVVSDEHKQIEAEQVPTEQELTERAATEQVPAEAPTLLKSLLRKFMSRLQSRQLP